MIHEPQPVPDHALGVHQFQATDNQGRVRRLSEFRGKVLLVVNTASQCGFTRQYAGLQALYDKYHAQGFEVLAFPCNQFNGQEPGTDAEISDFCRRGYGVEFPIFSKVEVNGPGAHPLFAYLQEALPGMLGLKALKWNFTKFLVDRRGQPVERFSPTTVPEKIEHRVEALLRA